MTPRFSIVIPTRNRAGLLRHALATAVGQTHGDVEIVVSDNASSDGTREVAHATGDPRVRYVRSDTPLNNADSWEFAVSHAAGEWVTVLGDDDGLVPSLVERVAPTLDDTGTELVAWATAFYVHPDTDPPWPVEDERNLLTIHPFSGTVAWIDAVEQSRRMFERREIEPVPAVRDCFVRRRLLDHVARGAGRVFGVPDPNWSLAAALVPHIPGYLRVDSPLSVTGCSTVHIGGGFQRNVRSHDVVREFEDDTRLSEVALRSRTCANLVAETLLRTKRRVPELAGFDLDPVGYLVSNHDELTDARRVADGGAELHEWRRALRGAPAPVRRAVRMHVARRRLERLARGVAGHFPGLRSIVDGLGSRSGSQTFRVIQGREHGFDDLRGAASYLETVLRAELGMARPVGV